MALEIEFTLENLAALTKALALGAREVEYENNGARKKIRYHSYSEMQNLRSQMRRELGLTGKTARINVSSSKGAC